MKDAVHHLKHTQKKVIRSARKDQQVQSSKYIASLNGTPSKQK